MTELDVRVETVRKLELKEGDVLFVTLGVANLGDGQGPWIPSAEEIVETRQAWAEIVPPGVAVGVSHFGENVEVIHAELFRAQVEAERRTKRAAGYEDYLHA